MNDIVDRIEKVMEEVEREHAPLTFAALVMRADSEVLQYDLIVSSPWFLSEGKPNSYNYLKEKLSKYLQKEDWQEFNRILLMKPQEQFIQDISRDADKYKTRDFANVRAAGIDLRIAHIFAAPADNSTVRLRSYSQ